MKTHGWLGVVALTAAAVLTWAAPWAHAQTPTAPAAPFSLELLAPAVTTSEPTRAAPTTREFVNLLGRTTAGATVQVAGSAAAVFSTGVFVRDRVPLALGINRLSITATSSSGQTLVRDIEIERLPVPAGVMWPVDRLFINGSSLRPAQALRVAPGEAVQVAVQATPGQRVEARLPGQDWQVLIESSLSAGQYSASLLYSPGADGSLNPAPVQLRLRATGLPRSAQPQVLHALSADDVGLWRADKPRLLAVGAQGAELLHGLHDVRLGGPFLAELPEGSLLMATGQQGEHYRVQLAPDSTAWVAASSVAWAPTGTPVPGGVMTTLSVRGGADGDVVSLPLPRGMPYAVQALITPDGQHFIEVDVWGTHHAATWISHRASAQLVREVTVLPIGPQHIRVRISLQQPRLWGWRSERKPNALTVTLRPPPVVARTGSPLNGLKVALEAGHGSADNLGAVGATGVPEKDINRWAVEALMSELQAAGAQVLLVREGDDNPPLRERARRASESGAQLFVSLHANSADTGAGYLRVSGVSTYYKHSTGRDLAAAVQKRLLEHSGLEDFGLVGNFNYTPVRRTTWMPAILVEQAFVSHPGDEAKLLDPAFRALMALAIRQGLEDFLGQR